MRVRVCIFGHRTKKVVVSVDDWLLASCQGGSIFRDGGRTLCANLALFFGQNWAHTVVSKRRFPWVSWIPNLGETPSYIMYSLNRAQTPGALTQIMLYVKTKKIHTSQSSLDFVTCVHVPSRSYENEHPPHGPRNDKWYNSGGRISSPWSRRTKDESTAILPCLDRNSIAKIIPCS